MVQKMKEFFVNMGVFFVVNIVTAVVWFLTQVPQAIESVEGLSLAWTGLMFVYMVTMSLLARDAQRDKQLPTQEEWELLFMYVVWVLLSVALGATIAANPDYEWSRNDSYALLIAIFGAMLAGAWAFAYRVSLNSAAPKSIFAICCKATPQFLMTSTVLMEGGSGLAGLALLTGMISILNRLGGLSEQASKMWKGDGAYGYYPNAKILQQRAAMRWMLLAESLNGLSWLAVCVAWVHVNNGL